MKKNIVVLGGGSAGWLTALTVRKFYPSDDYTISLVESEEIGILGAGEGSTPHLVEMFKFLDIKLKALIRECKATLKLGINFDNWNGDGKSFFHGFHTRRDLSSKKFDSYLPNILYVKSIAKGGSLDELHLSKALNDKKKAPFAIDKNKSTLVSFANTAIHFDARLLAQFLAKVSSKRRIRRIEGVVDKINNDDKGNIKQLILKDGTSIETDFVFDCSGFARLLVGKHFETPWVSYSESLPLDSAMPFFIDHDNDIAPQTDAIAMKYGWVWKIPVQGRYGCGYVFNSKYINNDQAKAEIEDYFNIKLEDPKVFKFEAGTYKDVFVKNCMAVGLSQGFIEPLEATSIWLSSLNLIEFLKMNGMNTNSKEKRKDFNASCYKKNELIMSFIYLHYLTKRNDSEFWKEFRVKNKMPHELKSFMEQFFESPFMSIDEGLWPSESYLAVASGLGLLDPDKFQNIVNTFGLKYDNSKETIIKEQSAVVDACISHKRFIEIMAQ